MDICPQCLAERIKPEAYTITHDLRDVRGHTLVFELEESLSRERIEYGAKQISKSFPDSRVVIIAGGSVAKIYVMDGEPESVAVAQEDEDG